MPYKDREKQRKYQRERLAKTRKDWLDENGPCVECSSWENLEVDHIDPATKVDHKVWSWSEERRLSELIKCQVLCTDCHRKKTARARLEQINHGITMYENHGCRCDICRLAKKRKNARRYAP